MNKLVVLLTIVLLLVGMDLNLSEGGQLNAPNLTINGIILSNRIGGGGLLIHPSFSLKKFDKIPFYTSAVNVSNLQGFKMNLNETLFYPSSISEINAPYFISTPKSGKIENHVLDFKLGYKGNSYFKYLEILETINYTSRIYVEQSQNFSYSTYTGYSSYHINASSGDKYLNLYIQGVIDNQRFIQLNIYRYIDYAKILIAIPLEGTNNFEFQEIGFTNFNLSVPRVIIPAINQNNITFLSIGLLIGIVLVLSVILYYKKKQ